MKNNSKILSVVALFAIGSLTLGAQTMYDALKYGDINYYGTARSMALGNAMTAVGGDLGSIVLNPAGSAVAGYSQFSVSQGVSTSTVGADYSPVAASDDFTSYMSSKKGRYIMPNVGVVINVPTPSSSTLKSYSMGFLISTTGRSLDRMSVTGRNDFTTMLGDMAYKAYGIDYNNLSGESAYDNYSWSIPLSYQSFMISELTGETSQYIGASEIDTSPNPDEHIIGLAGPIDQKYIMQHTGSRNDMLFNFGANFSDKIYLGFNLGLPILGYKENIYAGEFAVDPDDFIQEINSATARWQNSSQVYYLDTDAEGVYAQIGAIFLPFEGLRLGASIKTPTWYSVRERWGYDASTVYDTFSQSAYSPDGDYSYNLIMPSELNLGVAATLGSVALVSLDWSRVNYSKMEFRSAEDSFINGEFDEVNSEISRYAGQAKQLRFGIEYKVLPSLALRYGYTRKSYIDDKTTSNAFGIGYSSAGSFFADFVVRNTKYPYSWYYPYDDYVYDDTGSLIIRSNEIGYSKSLVDCVLTLGWRF